MVQKEKGIESAILKYLNLQPGVFAFKVNTTGVFDPVRKVYRKITNPYILKGTADILGIAYGKFIAIEVKTPQRERLVTDEQQSFLQRIREMGGYAMVACDLKQVEEMLKRLKTGYNPIAASMQGHP